MQNEMSPNRSFREIVRLTLYFSLRERAIAFQVNPIHLWASRGIKMLLFSLINAPPETGTAYLPVVLSYKQQFRKDWNASITLLNTEGILWFHWLISTIELYKSLICIYNKNWWMDEMCLWSRAIQFALLEYTRLQSCILFVSLTSFISQSHVQWAHQLPCPITQ